MAPELLLDRLEFAQAAIVFMMALVAMLLLGDNWAAIKEADKRATEASKKVTQQDLQHEAAHRGFGFTDKTPDKWDCRDEKCPRNTGRSRLW